MNTEKSNSIVEGKLENIMYHNYQITPKSCIV